MPRPINPSPPTTESRASLASAGSPARVSGDLILVELEAIGVLEILDDFKGRLDDEDPGLWDRIEQGWSQDSPRGGVHLLARVDGGSGNGSRRLAARYATEEEVQAGRLVGKTIGQVLLCETREEGGYVGLAPGRTVDGEYRIRHGGPETVATITKTELDTILSVVAGFNEIAAAPVSDGPPAPSNLEAVGTRPGDIFNAVATWEDVLILRPGRRRPGDPAQRGRRRGALDTPWQEGLRGVLGDDERPRHRPAYQLLIELAPVRFRAACRRGREPTPDFVLQVRRRSDLRPRRRQSRLRPPARQRGIRHRQAGEPTPRPTRSGYPCRGAGALHQGVSGMDDLRRPDPDTCHGRRSRRRQTGRRPSTRRLPCRPFVVGQDGDADEPQSASRCRGGLVHLVRGGAALRYVGKRSVQVRHRRNPPARWAPRG